MSINNQFKVNKQINKKIQLIIVNLNNRKIKLNQKVIIIKNKTN
jgi:hypothetical protein